ncbi:DinB family protein [Agriterribacter sp.]|uniref:DinB family protein n=1 Tax=Agriterribacter sp. TaxID=2821509 RepID=UPI002C802BFE|nr:DinB family protein [Agriterribacter sp.]HRO48444.1 DinB family protein [Agriterribacter sp.]HRQ19558.1 DinB family protein [Agriterribacter sp.]
MKQMKAMSKFKLLSSLEQEVEKHLAEAVSVFQNLPEETLLKPAPDGGWSMAQCLAHLNSYGRFYLPAITYAINHPAGNATNEKFKSGWLGNYFTQMMQPGNSTKKYKSPKDHSPTPDLDARAVVAEFIQQQEQLMRCLRKAKATDINATRVPVSISKWIRLKLGDTFRFLIAHNERHMLQAKRHLILCPL